MIVSKDKLAQIQNKLAYRISLAFLAESANMALIDLMPPNRAKDIPSDSLARSLCPKFNRDW